MPDFNGGRCAGGGRGMGLRRDDARIGKPIVFSPMSGDLCGSVVAAKYEARDDEKKALYFDAGAREVWVCEEAGEMSFFTDVRSAAKESSKSVRDFRRRLERSELELFKSKFVLLWDAVSR